MTGADFIELLNSIDPTIKIPSHNVTSIAKQATIAYEAAKAYGKHSTR